MQSQSQHQQSKSKSEYSPLIQTFIYSLKSKKTQEMYLTLIDYFEKWHKGKIEDLLLLSNVKVVEETLIQYIISLRDRHLAYATIKQRLAAIVSFLELNDVTINHKKLKKFIGEHNKTVKDQAYTQRRFTKNVSAFNI